MTKLSDCYYPCHTRDWTTNACCPCTLSNPRPSDPVEEKCKHFGYKAVSHTHPPSLDPVEKNQCKYMHVPDKWDNKTRTFTWRRCKKSGNYRGYCKFHEYQVYFRELPSVHYRLAEAKLRSPLVDHKDEKPSVSPSGQSSKPTETKNPKSQVFEKSAIDRDKSAPSEEWGDEIGTLGMVVEEILRGQFVDRAYRTDGSTSWGVLDTKRKILALLSTSNEKARREERERIKEKVLEIRENLVYPEPIDEILALLEKGEK